MNLKGVRTCMHLNDVLTCMCLNECAVCMFVNAHKWTCLRTHVCYMRAFTPMLHHSYSSIVMQPHTLTVCRRLWGWLWRGGAGLGWGPWWAVRAHAQTYLHIKVHAHSFLFMRRWSSLGAWAHLGTCMSYLIIRLTSFGLILVPTSCTGIAHLHVCFCMSSNESASHMRRRSAWRSHQNVIEGRMSANQLCA